MKILIFCLPGIGDGLMATPMIKLLRKKYPHDDIDVACMFDGVAYIFKNNPFITRTYVLHLYKNDIRNAFVQLLPLRKKKYDISILSFPAYRSEYHIVQRLIGAKKRIATRFESGYWRECNFLDTHLVPVDETKHNVINNLQLLTALGIDWQKVTKKENIRYDFFPSHEDKTFGEQYIKNLGWKNKNIIGIHPGSTNSPAALLRRWPIDRYAEVAKKLINNKKNILIFTGPDEQGIGERLQKLVNNPDHCVIVNTTFGQAVGVLNTIDLLLCNDNGFGHLAVALHKPIITLWASTNDIWSSPYDKSLVTLLRPKGYASWYRYDLKREVPHIEKDGMGDITVTEVEKALFTMKVL